MAVGDIGSGHTGNCIKAVKLLENQAVANSPPTLATDGVPNYPNPHAALDTGACFMGKPARESSLCIVGTGTGTIVGTFRLWGYLACAGEWFPLGTGTEALKGVINAGVAIGEVKADKVLHAEPVLMSGHFDRLYLELSSPGGTSPSFSAWLVTPLTVSY